MLCIYGNRKEKPGQRDIPHTPIFTIASFPSSLRKNHIFLRSVKIFLMSTSKIIYQLIEPLFCHNVWIYWIISIGQITITIVVKNACNIVVGKSSIKEVVFKSIPIYFTIINHFIHPLSSLSQVQICV